MSETTLENKTGILSELWMGYRDDQNLIDFFAYNDLGLPLAYAISNGIVKGTDMSDKFIEETFTLFLASLGVDDEGYDSLDDIFLMAG